MDAVMPSRYALAILVGLQDKHIYQGTVPDGVRATRRRRNRVARRQRNVNRARTGRP